MKANKRMEFARTARPTRKSDALLLAAHSRRWAPEMRNLKVAIAALALSLTTACLPSDPAKERKLVSESYSFSDPAKQERLKRELAAAGVPFTTETFEGQEHISWEARYAPQANAVRTAVLGPDLPQGRHIAYDAEGQAKFKQWLTQNGIPYSTLEKDGREYVVWEDNVDDKVRAWHLPLPPR
jgi:hypothetical protein